jgi:hypothetical protein
MEGANQSSYSGWTLVELFGHQREAGFVTTQYYGDKAMFQVDAPEIEAREETLTAPRYIDHVFAPAGTVVSRGAIPGRSRLINPGAVYAMNPATEEAVKAAISASERREIKVISLPEGKQLAAALPENDEDCDNGDPDEVDTVGLDDDEL